MNSSYGVNLCSLWVTSDKCFVATYVRFLPFFVSVSNAGMRMWNEEEDCVQREKHKDTAFARRFHTDVRIYKQLTLITPKKTFIDRVEFYT